MARVDPHFFGIRWSEIGRLAESPWYAWSDKQGELLPSCAGWLVQEKEIDHTWRAAIDATNVYEGIRRALPAQARAQADRLFGQTFGIWGDDTWAEGTQGDERELALLAAASLNHGIGPALADELIALWQPGLRAAIERAWLPRPQDTSMNSCETMIGYAESWVALLRRIRARGEWGLLLALAY